MKPRKVAGSMLLANVKPILEYQPLGVVGVIGPWNYPLFTPMGSIVYALAAGNAVVFKPSEFTPGVGVWLAEAFREVVPEQPVFQVVTGFGETGAALCRAGVDKLAFTGSAPTGRKIMAACAETLTPVLLELGGKDAMLVDADADIKAAADAAVWGACSNAGQTCIGIERVYVVDAVYDEFVREVTEAAKDLKSGGDAPVIGPMTMPKQLDIVREHIDEALDRGARAIVGGRESVHAPYVDTEILVDVPDDTKVMREETFGPVLPITRVSSLDEAVDKANRTAYGLGAAVFAKKRGYDAARRMRSGMTSVNSVLAFAGFPSLPFGGVGESGFGRIHGEDGLKEFTRPKSIAVQRFSTPAQMMSFRRPAWLPKVATKLGDLRYGRIGR
jgi:acyl-CoA reductase-like NAD-dependent aldehyde dehydrogenase